jgi:O-antigen/teichoic acid export membrane protein
VARGYDGALKAGFWETLKWSLGMAIIALGAGVYYYLQGNIMLTIAMLMIAIAQPILKSSELYQYFLEGKKDFKTRSIYLSIWEGIEVILLVGSLLVTENILIILAVFFLTNSIPPLFFYFRTLDRFKPSPKTDPKTSAYGKHLSLMRVLSKIAIHLDKILVFHFLGAAQLAIYAFATLPIEKLQSSRSIIGTLALPKFSDTNIPTLKKTLPRKTWLFFVVCLAVVVSFIFAAPYIYELIFPQYLESVKYAQIYSLSILFFPAILYGKTLTAHARTRELYISNVGTNIIKIISLLILLPMYGIWGAIYVLLGEALLKFLFSAGFFYNLKE